MKATITLTEKEALDTVRFALEARGYKVLDLRFEVTQVSHDPMERVVEDVVSVLVDVDPRGR